MTPLSAIFVDASLAEEKRYGIHAISLSGMCAVSSPALPLYEIEPLFASGLAECERWVAVKAKNAGVAAVRASVSERSSETMYAAYVLEFLNELAGGE